MPEIFHCFFLSFTCQFHSFSEHVFLMCKFQIHYLYVFLHTAYKVNLKKINLVGALIGTSDYTGVNSIWARACDQLKAASYITYRQSQQFMSSFNSSISGAGGTALTRFHTHSLLHLVPITNLALIMGLCSSAGADVSTGIFLP